MNRTLFSKVALVLILVSLVQTKEAMAASFKYSPKTCIEINAQYPNGVARDKRARGLKKYPKAKVSQKIYMENAGIDFGGNYNGIVCDKAEVVTSAISTSGADLIVNRLHISVYAACTLENPRIEYGSTVGFATLLIDNTCNLTIFNLDKLYSLPEGYFQFAVMYNVFDQSTINTRGLKDLVWNSAQVTLYGTGEIRPNTSKTQNNLGELYSGKTFSFYGTKEEVEQLNFKIKKGLKPTLYLGLFYRNDDGTYLQGCFTNAGSPDAIDSLVSNTYTCSKPEDDNLFVWQ